MLIAQRWLHNQIFVSLKIRGTTGLLSPSRAQNFLFIFLIICGDAELIELGLLQAPKLFWMEKSEVLHLHESPIYRSTT